ncbi:thiamine/thiamine pyrophosphate ABC transporter permease ThiP [Pseudaestuariivita sp.]|uniref:thiamine/thiamine pyrophosphate ABC transporter permease ThiP n=1 Tax=Pseudaestuariivita sp. TaxID=2211669 RepID=UPI004059D2F3
MAPRALQIIAAGTVLAAVLVPLGAVMWRAEGWGRFGPGDWAALRFTLWQAALSAALSVALAVPVARALARRVFPGRAVLITLLGAPFILPTIVAIFGLLAVFGQQGLVSQVLGLFGLPPMQIYGWHGVILAHVFFNLPLATRLILQGWLAVPAEHLRLSAQLGLGARARWQVIEAPMLRAVAPGAFVVIFVICMSSFAVALTLGGGPRATTLELAIYQAFRFEFDLGRAALLSLVQLVVAGGAAAFALWWGVSSGFSAGLDRSIALPGGRRWLDALWIVLAAAFLLVPLGVVFARGIGGMLSLPPEVWHAAGHSLTVALGSTALTLALALCLLGRLGEGVSLLGIAISPLVLGTGLFVLLQPFVRPFDFALVVTAGVNALMALPFVLRILRPEAEQITADFTRLSQGLGLTRRAWWRWVMLPRLRRPLGFSAGLTAALTMGDLGVIALFADPDRATLPLMMYRLMGSYRMEDAAAAAVLLLMLSLGLFWLCDRGGRARA